MCVSAGWSFLAHFAFELQTNMVKAGGNWEQQREPCRQWGAWAEASMRLIIQGLYVLGRCSLGIESLL